MGPPGPIGVDQSDGGSLADCPHLRVTVDGILQDPLKIDGDTNDPVGVDPPQICLYDSLCVPCGIGRGQASGGKQFGGECFQSITGDAVYIFSHGTHQEPSD